MVLAAGRGERMRPLTDACPKPMLEVAGTPLIGHHLMRLAGAGFDRVVVNLAYRGDQIRRYVGDGSAFGLDVRYSDEGGQALETGGGILHALPLLAPQGDDRPFAVINGDVYTDFPLGTLHRGAADMPARVRAHLVLVDNPAHHPHGDFAFDGVHVLADAAADGPRLTFSGIGLYRPSLFHDRQPDAPAFPLAPVLRAAAAEGRVTAQRHAGLWSDVGTPARLAELNKSLA